MQIFENIRLKFQHNRFFKYMGFKFVELSPGKSVISMKNIPDLRNTQGILHGGAIASLIDTAMGTALQTLNVPNVATINLEVKYLKSVKCDEVLAISTIRYTSNSIAIIECEVRDHQQELYGLAIGTFKKII